MADGVFPDISRRGQAGPRGWTGDGPSNSEVAIEWE